jgi:hypothetical protein
MTKEEIENYIAENPIYKDSIKGLSIEEQSKVIADVRKIIDDFYNNVITPLERITNG